MRFALRFLAASLASLFLWSSAMAKPAVVVNIKTGQVIYAEEPHRKWYPASTTKLMTAYLAFEALRAGTLKMDDVLISTKTALKEPPSKIGLPEGSTITVDKALDTLIIKSANDVSVMFAEKLAGDVPSFAKMMNAKAKKIGMTRTNFVNPNGLHNPLHYSTAHDMARMATAIMRDFPEYKERFTRFKMKLGKRVLTSYNSLLKRNFPGASGLKTGFVCASGFNIVGAAKRGNLHLVSVVFGSRSVNDRHDRAAALLEYGFAMHDWKTKLFGDNLDNLKIENTALVNKAGNMRPIICKPRPRKRKRRKKRRRRR